MNTEGKEGTAKRVTLLNPVLTGDNKVVATVVKFELTMTAIMS
jgi:hypothetical protein